MFIKKSYYIFKLLILRLLHLTEIIILNIFLTQTKYIVHFYKLHTVTRIAHYLVEEELNCRK